MQKLIYLVKSVWRRAKGYFAVTLLQNCMAAAIPLIDILGIGMVVEKLTTGAEIKDIVMTALLYVILNLAVSLLKIALQAMENGLMRKSTNTLQCGYMRDCVNVDYHFVQNRTLLDLKPKSMSARPEFFLNLWGRCIGDLAKVIMTASIMVSVNVWFILLIGILAVGVIWTNVYQNKKEVMYRQSRAENDRKLEYLYHTMTEYTYAKEIRINRADGILLSKYEEIADKQLKNLNTLIRKKVRAESLGKLISAVELVAVYGFFTFQVFRGNNSLAECVVLVPAVTLCLNAVVSLFSNIGYVKNNFVAVDFLQKYEQTVREHSVVRDSCLLADKPVNYAGHITFEHVSFHYPESEKMILKDVSFTIRAGKKTAIVGLNGAGKSTLISLILRLYQPTEGRILIDGVDINSIPYDTYISHFGVVLQDFALFAYSIKENITFDSETDEERMEQVIAESGLDRVIKTLPKGTDTPLYKDLEDDGIELSGGNAQRLALARALYQSGSIVVLDEPTSAFDPIAEYEFFQQLHHLAAEKTTIFISHRLSSTVFCDHILVLAEGRIIEQGNHDELMQQEGEYQKLFHLQAQFYEKGRTDEA